MCSEHGEIVLPRAVAQGEGGRQSPHRDPRRNGKVVPFKQLIQRRVVLAEIQHAAVEALAVTVARAVDAALEDVRGAEVLQFLDVFGEQQARLAAVLLEPHVQLRGGFAENFVQTGRLVGRGAQRDLVQEKAVHQRTAAEFAHRTGQLDAAQAAAVVERIAADFGRARGQHDRADSRGVVLRFRPAAGDADGEHGLAAQVGRALAERVSAQPDDRRAADRIRQDDLAVARLAPQHGHALRRFRAGEQQLVFAFDRAHPTRSFPFLPFGYHYSTAAAKKRDKNSCFA